jgi:cobaltochelatase CobS
MLVTNVKQIPLEEFGMKIKGKTVRGLDDPFNPYVPKKETYAFPVSATRSILSFLEYPEETNFWYWGLHGTGKTSLVKQICARLNFPVFSVNGSETLEVEDLFSRNTVKNGTLLTVNEALTKAYTEGGVFLFNEIDLVDPSKLAALNEILSSESILVPGIDKLLVRHENFRFIVTANTNGSYNDDNGIDFVGTSTMNIAFMDRFIVTKAEYLPVEEEIDMLVKYAEDFYFRVWHKNNNIGVKLKPIITNMVSVATETRKSAENSGDFDRPISFRGLKRWVGKLIQYQGAPNVINMSLAESVTNSLSASHRNAVERFTADVFGSDFKT